MPLTAVVDFYRTSPQTLLPSLCTWPWPFFFPFNLSPIYSSVSPTPKTDLHFDVVDVFGVAERDLGVVRIVSTVLDFNADLELLLVGLYVKAAMSQHKESSYCNDSVDVLTWWCLVVSLFSLSPECSDVVSVGIKGTVFFQTHKIRWISGVQAKRLDVKAAAQQRAFFWYQTRIWLYRPLEGNLK